MPQIRGKKVRLVSNQALRVLTLSSSSASNGSYGADSFGSDWTNGAGVRSGNTFYANDRFTYTAKTNYLSRDFQIDGFWTLGTAYGRISGGKGLYFYHTANYFEVGVALVNNPSINEISYTTEKSILGTKDMTTVSGYSPSYNGTLFSLRVEGVDIVCKYGNTEFMRLNYGFVWGENGNIGIKTITGYCYDFVATHLPKKAIYSDLTNYLWDVRDVGASTFHTTGSMTGTTLTLANVTGLSAGMRLHTNLTGLPDTNGRPAGTRGTRGMKTWPQLSYVDATAMNADTSKGAGTWCWLESTGINYTWSGSSWGSQEIFQAIGPETVDLNYYLSHAIPINYRGTILSISGNVLTMDTATDVPFSGTDVYFDNSPAFNNLSTDRPDWDFVLSGKVVTINVPAGNWAVSEGWFTTLRPGIILQGAGGRNSTTRIFAPDGGNPFQMKALLCPRMQVKGICFESNGRENGYGLWWRDSNPNHTSFIVPMYGYPQFVKEHYGSGPYFDRSENAYVTDCKFVDFLQYACVFGSSDNSVADGFDIVHTTGHRKYFQWQMNGDICNNITYRNFTAQSATIIGMGELFNGDGCLFENGTIINGRVSSNSSANVNFKNIHFRWTANSRPSWLDPTDPGVNYNSNAYGYSRPGGTVEDCTFTFDDYIDAFHNLKTAIVVNAMANQDTFPDSYVGVSIKRCTLTGPNYASPATQMGPVMVVSTRKNTTVEDCVCTGTTGVNSDLYNASIGLNGPGGYLKRNTAYKMTVGSTVTVGTGADANTGTIVVI